MYKRQVGRREESVGRRQERVDRERESEMGMGGEETGGVERFRIPPSTKSALLYFLLNSEFCADRRQTH